MSKKKKLVIIGLIIVVIIGTITVFVFWNNDDVLGDDQVSVSSPEGGQSTSPDSDQASFGDMGANDDVQDNRDSRVGSSKSIRNDN